MMHLILFLVLGMLGLWRFGISGGITGVLIGLLLAQVLQLRTRVAVLEKSAALTQAPESMKEEGVVFGPAGEKATLQETGNRARFTPTRPVSLGENVSETTAQLGSPKIFARLFRGLGVDAPRLIQFIRQFFTSGNLVVKIGVIILFFGVAFLLKYAALRNMLPIELRLIGVAVSGVAALGCGWWLRQSKAGYGLVLQGGGVGILYLVVFAAARLYDFLPIPLSLTVMIGLVGLSGLLAVLQEAKSLAVFGVVGGFLAPVLMTTGGGSHVLLFSYYALLNAGILGIAWFKSWRELNLLGFIFTFAMGTWWGSSGYQPEHFASTEPFLVLFFVFYVLISILFAHRQPIKLRGFIDGPLVFGLPLIVYGLQSLLVRDQPYGMAFSALVLGLLYLGLAVFVWRRMNPAMHLLAEAFLALGVIFASLAVPLALDGHWSASIWALEGAAMVWVGMRQKRLFARLFGILLQLAAAFIFLDSVWYPFIAVPFANRYFLGCFFLAFAALFSSYCLDTRHCTLHKWEHYLPLPLMIGGLVWWYLGGLREVDKQMRHIGTVKAFLLFCSASSIALGMAAIKISWPRLGGAMYLQLTAMVGLALFSYASFASGGHFLMGWGAVIWPVAFIVQYRILYLFSETWPQRNRSAWHVGTLWLLLGVVCHEAGWAVQQMSGLAEVWAMICWALIPCAALLLLVRLGEGISWPVGRHAAAYLGMGGMLPACGVVLWTIWSFTFVGDPRPLRYITFLNPLELVGLVGIATLVRWRTYCQNKEYTIKYLLQKQALWGLGMLLFCWMNTVLARSVHFYVGIPYYPAALYSSAVFQAALAALWGFGALALTVWAARKGSRTLWGVGAILLAMVVVKLFLVDLSGTGTIARIVSFLVVGVLMLIIGYFSPLPPKTKEKW